MELNYKMIAVAALLAIIATITGVASAARMRNEAYFSEKWGLIS